MKSMATDQNNVIVTGKSLNNYVNRNYTFPNRFADTLCKYLRMLFPDDNK